MSYEKKKITDAWEERCIPDEELLKLDTRLWELKQVIDKCRDLLAQEGRTLYHEISQDRIDLLMEQRQDVSAYARNIAGHFSNYLDELFYRDFVNGATEYLSRISLSDFSTENTVGLTQRKYYSRNTAQSGRPGHGTAGAPLYEEVEKDKLTFSDFLGSWAEEESSGGRGGNPAEVSVAGLELLLGNEQSAQVLMHGGTLNASMGRFAEAFADNYREMKEQGLLEESEIEDLYDYLKAVQIQGEFEHSMDKPVLEFLNDVLDMTIIPPLIEAATGTEILTGEDLSGYARGVKAVGAALDLMSLGQATKVSGVLKAGGMDAVRMLGRVGAVELGTNVGSYAALRAGEEMNLPEPLTLLLGLSAGAAVNYQLGKRLLRSGTGSLSNVGVERIAQAEDLPVINRVDYQDVFDAFDARNVGDALESGTGVKYSPVNPGPLSEDVANSFNGATYTERVLTEDTVMYRVSGGNAKEVGSYMSMTPQGGGLQSQLDLALNPTWGNTTENITKVVVPKGTTIYEGIAAPQNIYDSLGNVIGTLPGGGNQVYIPTVEAGWFQ